MMRRIVVLLALLALPVMFVAAQVVVEYVEGSVEMREGSRWYDVYIGDTIASEDAVRLSAGGYLELRDGSRSIKLTRPGTYEIADLVESTQKTASAGLGGLVLGRISRLTGQSQQEQQTAAGGARASEAVSNNEMQWAGSLEDLIEEGVGYLGSGDFQDAYYTFDDAYGSALDSELPEIAFYLGYSLLMMGDPMEASTWLEEYKPNPQTVYYPVHVLALGQLMLESFAYEDAIEYLMPLARETTRDSADRQSAELMLGIAYSGLGMNTQARTYLTRAGNTLPGSDAAAAAARLLQDL